MNELNRESARKLVARKMQQHGVRPNFKPHVSSILKFCQDEQEMDRAIDQLFKKPAALVFLARPNGHN